MAKEHMLTTFDNPYDPFTQFTLWRLFDIEKGYYTCERLAKFVELQEGMTQKEINEAEEKAIDLMIEHDFLNIYKRVAENEMISH